MSNNTKEKLTPADLVKLLKIIGKLLKERKFRKLYTAQYKAVQSKADSVFAIIVIVIVVMTLFGNVIARRVNYDNIMVPAAVGTTAQVNEWDLRLHKHKSLYSKVVDTFTKGTQLTLTGRIYHSHVMEYTGFLSDRYDCPKGKIMVEVSDGTKTGWVARDYLDLAETTVIPQRPHIQKSFNIAMLIITIVGVISYFVTNSILICEDELIIMEQREECKKKR